MFRDLGLGDNLFDIDATPAEQISRRVLALHRDFPDAKVAAATALREVRRVQAQTLDVVQRTIG